MDRVNPVGLRIRQLLRFASLTTRRLNVDYPVDRGSIRNAIDTLRVLRGVEDEFRRSRRSLEQVILKRPEYKAMLFQQHALDQQQDLDRQPKQT
jgi:hypothetical protein